MGHLARECPNKQLVSLVEETTPIYDTYDEEELNDEEDEVVYPDCGEALITTTCSQRGGDKSC